MSRKLIVSLHDVAPPFEEETQRQLTLLREIGISKVVLKVVPSWHGRWPIADSAPLQKLIAGELERGSQLVLHGFEHRRRDSLRGSPVQRLRARLFAADAAELLALDSPAAEHALARALAQIDDAGLPRPTTFCAPGWLLARDLEPVLVRARIRWLTGMFSLRDMRARRTYPMAGAGYMGADGLHEHGVALLNTLVESTWLRRADSARIYLHPQWERGNRALPRIIALIARLVEEGWESVTYSDLYEST